MARSLLLRVFLKGWASARMSVFQDHKRFAGSCHLESSKHTLPPSRWWDRAFVDVTNDKNDPYDKGAPDYQAEPMPFEPPLKLESLTKHSRCAYILTLRGCGPDSSLSTTAG